jgi:hypothetical protein
MAEVLKKKAPPPRPLKRSSLSGTQTNKADGGLSFVGTQTSGYDQVRHENAHNDKSLEVSEYVGSRSLQLLID